MTDTTSNRLKTGAPVRLRAVAIPAEHGGWSFLLEPIVLGLLVAPSVPGLLLGIGMFFAFLARHPLKLALSDRRRGKRLARTPAAERFALGYAAVSAAGFGRAVALHSPEVLLPLVAAAPLFTLQAYFDATNQARAAAAELLGVVALAASAASITLAGGWSLVPAFALWALLAARGLPSILYVRTRLRLERGQPHDRRLSLIAHIAALIIVSVLAAGGLIPAWSISAPLVLLARAVYGLSPYRRGRTAKQIGVQEVFFGVVAIALIALSYAGN
ncbi:MAG: YwiC-like family protein [Anaerolineae bacterium]|nr:YwiC-like family protein [Anaerolineae bacterium]